MASGSPPWISKCTTRGMVGLLEQWENDSFGVGIRQRGACALPVRCAALRSGSAAAVQRVVL